MTSPPAAPPARPPGAVTLLSRALRLRCPQCGGRPVFVTWVRMCPSCPACGLRFERGERGYWLGAYFFNLMAMEAVFAVWFAGFLIATWPSPPWGAFQTASVVLMVLFPFAFFPFSKTTFLAFDLLVRPATPEDFETPHEKRFRSRAGD